MASMEQVLKQLQDMTVVIQAQGTQLQTQAPTMEQVQRMNSELAGRLDQRGNEIAQLQSAAASRSTEAPADGGGSRAPFAQVQQWAPGPDAPGLHGASAPRDRGQVHAARGGAQRGGCDDRSPRRDHASLQCPLSTHKPLTKHA